MPQDYEKIKVGDEVRIKCYPDNIPPTVVRKIVTDLFVNQTEPVFWVGRDPDKLFGMFARASLEKYKDDVHIKACPYCTRKRSQYMETGVRQCIHCGAVVIRGGPKALTQRHKYKRISSTPPSVDKQS